MDFGLTSTNFVSTRIERREMNLEEKLFTKLFMNQAIVLEKRQVNESVFHVKLGGDIRFKNITPGQHLRVLLFPNQQGKLRDRVRTYSIWHFQRDEAGLTIDIAICTHANGPGSQWVRSVETGDTILISNPLGKFTLDRSRQNHLFIGDVSALPHFYCFARHLAPNQMIRGIFYGEDESAFFSDFDRASQFRFIKVTPGTEDTLISYCKNLHVESDTIIYIAGDGNMCVSLYKLFTKILNFPRKSVKAKPFWMLGKTGLE